MRCFAKVHTDSEGRRGWRVPRTVGRGVSARHGLGGTSRLSVRWVESGNVNERVLSEVPDEIRTGYYPGYEPGLIDLAEFLRVFQRRAGLLIGTVCVLMVIATIGVFQLSPRYTAGTKVLLDPKQQQVVDIESVVSALTYDNQMVESEIAVIQSRGLIAQVIEELGLYRQPEFNPALRARLAAEKCKVELSEHARLLSKLAELPDVRQDLVDRVKAEIEAGTYDTADKIDALLDELARDLE